MNTRYLAPAVALVSLASLSVQQPARAAGAIRISANPNVLLADGNSTATVTADVRGSNGRPVRDGTEVRFYTTAGTITQVAFTSGGVARATLKSSTIPQAANISVSVGIDQAVMTLPIVDKVVEAAVGGRVMRLTANYVAFSEDKRYIQADDQVKLRFRGVEIQANSVQVDLNGETVKALGKVQIASGDKTLVGDRVWLDLKSFEGYVIAIRNRQWFSAYGLTELPERPKKLNPDFELADLSDSKLMWVGKSANYIFGERVQMQGARAFVGGMKTFRMPFHQTDLTNGFNGPDQYVGFGSDGISVDLPLYLRMTPGSSTALHFGYGSRTGGIGNFTVNNGLSLDLVQKYGFSGASEGTAMLTNLSSLSQWGVLWEHNQQITKTTRMAANFQFPQHRDLYGGVNLTSGLPIGNVTASFNGAKTRLNPLATTMALGFETKPKQIAGGKLGLSGVANFYRRDQQEVRVFRGNGIGLGGRGIRANVAGEQYQSVGVRAAVAPVTLSKGLTFNSTATLQAVTGNRRNGFGPTLETSLQKTLPRNGLLTFGVNYNHLTTVTDLLPQDGRMNATLNLSWPVTNRLRLSAFGSMGVDSQNKHSVLQASYQLTNKWRMDMLHNMFQFGGYGDSDLQFGLSRAFGSRELGLYWSRREGRMMFTFGASRF